MAARPGLGAGSAGGGDHAAWHRALGLACAGAVSGGAGEPGAAPPAARLLPRQRAAVLVGATGTPPRRAGGGGGASLRHLHPCQPAWRAVRLRPAPLVSAAGL